MHVWSTNNITGLPNLQDAESNQEMSVMHMCPWQYCIQRPEGASQQLPGMLASNSANDNGVACRQSRNVTFTVSNIVRWRRQLDFFITHLSGRPVGRLEPKAQAILRLGVYEVVHQNLAPHVISEHVELTKQMVRPGAAKLVNGRLIIATHVIADYPAFVSLGSKTNGCSTKLVIGRLATATHVIADYPALLSLGSRINSSLAKQTAFDMWLQDTCHDQCVLKDCVRLKCCNMHSGLAIHSHVLLKETFSWEDHFVFCC